MIEAFANLFSAFGLSTSAGVNAYLPLLAVSLTARFFPDVMKLQAPYDVMADWWVIGLLSVLLLVEFFADKVPAVNHINDVIQTFIRPAAGAVLFAAASSNIVIIHPVLAASLGILVAGGVHAAKTVVVRPAVTATTAGTGTPVVSILEDIFAAALSIAAIVLPVVAGVIVVLFATTTIWLLWRWQRRRADKRALVA